MTRGITLFGATLALLLSVSSFAQRGGNAAFTATGERCEDVTWSQEALQRYPNIASACQEVLERNGSYFVRFEGDVRRVADRGNRVTISFEGGDTLTLTPPENLRLIIDGRERAPRDLRPGDDLTFYVPQNQLAATFFAGQPATSEPQEVPISPTTDSTDDLLAQADDIPATQPTETEQPRLPGTASFLPFAAVGGFALIGLGGALTLWRKLRPLVQR